VFFNNTDRDNALDKIAFVQRIYPRIEYVGICLPNSAIPYLPNPNPGVASTPAVAQSSIPGAPYLIHWNVNNNPVYYKIARWNEHLVLRCGWTLQFNMVLSIYT